MADLSQAQPVAFNCEGGLVKNRSTFMMQPGEALELENFEPDVEGGYKRIKGFAEPTQRNTTLNALTLTVTKS